MKKYLFLAIALLGLASCAKDDLADGNKPIHSGEVEESYIAINLAASDITRAQDGFDDGTAEERKVHHADFFFFDGNGNAFPVNVSGDRDSENQWTDERGGSSNHLRAVDLTFHTDEDDDDISDTSEAVLLLKTYKGEYPSQIVAVLNWSPDPATAYSLSQLHAAVSIQSSIEGDTYFVMSNSVYAQNGKAVYATPLSYDNIKNSVDAAMGAPVEIYVERVAAKVNVLGQAEYNLNQNTDTGYVLMGGLTLAGGVYAKILGWDLYRDNTQSKLIKEISADWTDDELGFSWNNSPWYRCYWADSLDAPTNDPIYGNTPLAINNHTYIGENTTGKGTCTKVVIKAQLVTKVNDVNTPLELAVWNNVKYVNEVSVDPAQSGISLRTAVANTLKNTYFAKTSNGAGTITYVGLKPEDLVCVAGGTNDAPNDVLANEVYFQLSDTGKTKDWHKLVNGVYERVAGDDDTDNGSISATNAALKTVPSAVFYKDGQTFYYVDIEHLGNGGGKPGDYGIVRNHVYKLNINSIKGYGSPVYTGVSHLEYPPFTELETYVSAKINILSWKLVEQAVNIQN